MEIKGILFDKDGTIIDFNEVWGTAATPVIETIMSEYGIACDTNIISEALESIGVYDGVIAPEGALAWKPYNLIAEDLLSVLEKFSENISCQSLEKSLKKGFYEQVTLVREDYPVFTDMKTLMQKLKDKGINVGIATTDEYEATKKCMEKLSVDEYITFYGTAGTDYPVKPDGRLIELAAQQWQITPQQILMIGDTPNDMRFAKNGGAYAVGVTCGVGKKNDMEALADRIIDSIDDLLELLEELWQR